MLRLIRGDSEDFLARRYHREVSYRFPSLVYHMGSLPIHRRLYIEVEVLISGVPEIDDLFRLLMI